MGKELKCGNKICWVIFTVIFFILAIVGISFVTNPADSFDYGCGGGGGTHCSKSCGADEMEGENFCSNYLQECAGPKGAKAKCEAGDKDYKGKCGGDRCKDLDFNTGQCNSYYKESDCLCFTDCGDALGKAVGKFVLGCALLALGLILGFTFCCGIVPCCCFAKDTATVIPQQSVMAQPVMAQQGMVAQPMMVQQGMVAQPMIQQGVVAQPMVAMAQPIVAQPMVK